MSSSHSPAPRPHLLVAERSRGPQRGCGSQAAQAPRLGGLRRLQGPPVDGGVRSAVVGGVRQRVVGRRQGYRLAVRVLAGRGDRMGGELQGEERVKHHSCHQGPLNQTHEVLPISKTLPDCHHFFTLQPQAVSFWGTRLLCVRAAWGSRQQDVEAQTQAPHCHLYLPRSSICNKVFHLA